MDNNTQMLKRLSTWKLLVILYIIMGLIIFFCIIGSKLNLWSKSAGSIHGQSVEGFLCPGLTLSPWLFSGILLFFFCALPVLFIVGKRREDSRKKEVAARAAELEEVNANLGREIIKGNKIAEELEIFRTVFKGSMDGMLIVDIDGEIKIANRAMAANAMKGGKGKCLNAGMNDYVAKPVNPDDLKAVLGGGRVTNARMKM